MFDPGDVEQGQPRLSSSLEIPSRVDDEVTAFIRHLIADGPDSVAHAVAGASKRGRHVLTAYAERMSSLSVRRRDRRILLDAVVANVVGGFGRNRRESLMAMAPIEDAAGRIGVNLSELFDEASAIVGESGAESLMLWLSRRPKNRTLTAMRYALVQDAGGLRYKSTWP